MALASLKPMRTRFTISVLPLLLLLLLLSIPLYAPALMRVSVYYMDWQQKGGHDSFGVPVGHHLPSKITITAKEPLENNNHTQNEMTPKDVAVRTLLPPPSQLPLSSSSPVIVVTKAIPSTGGNTTTTTTGGDDGDVTTSQQLHRTKIVGFINERYVNVAIRWYDRLTALGYTEHVIIATDNATSHVLETSFPQYRIEASYRPPLPQQFWTLPYGKKMRKEVEMLFAYRYVYLLEQLKAGYHVLITDVDNIFSKYHPMSEMEASEFDVFHALENKHPTKVYEAMGFVVCGGMGWFRSSPTTIQFIQLIVDRCGDCCDDQVVLNSILAFDMGMQWNLTDWHKSFRTKNTNQTKLDGLLTKSFTGVSNTTGHKVKLWDHEFAYRGANDPVVCPVNNWVSMPFVIFESRWQGASAKHKSYDIWDSYCPNEYSNNMTKRVEGRLPSENTKI